jgi:hypothetical protein
MAAMKRTDGGFKAFAKRASSAPVSGLKAAIARRIQSPRQSP